MPPTDRELMQQALRYMESVGQMDMYPEEWAIVVALRSRLAQPEQELVCVCGAIWEGQELVSTPPQRTWVGSGDIEDSNAYLTPPQRKPLTDEQIKDALVSVDAETKRLPSGFRDFARAIEAAHGIKGEA